MDFYAHSTSRADRSDWQPLAEHSQAVSKLAAEFASVFGGGAFADAAGQLHDIGKCVEEFLRRLSGGTVRVDHATRGAMLALEKYGDLGYLIAYSVAGHHAGLANGQMGKERTALRDRLRGKGLPPLLEGWQREIALPELSQEDLPLECVAERRWFQIAFLVRMLFSCLVDADFLDTERFYDKLEGREAREISSVETQIEQLRILRERLDQHLSTFVADTEINTIRAEILGHVRQEATLKPGLFSLTVPTGGGKTLASLAFALDHAIEHGLRRVIFVIPFTSVVEQNARVFREALGDLGEAAVLEHHSAFTAPQVSRAEPERYQSREKLRLAMENWDAPIVVTTAVQFFESLFAARSAQCRKLHNIAGSVVILDEAQTLPLKLLRPAVATIDELARNYRTSLVLCTATQPALQKPTLPDGLENVRELAPNPPDLFRRLERVRVRYIGVLDDDGLARYMREHEQILCIVNNRRHARAVYQSMKELPGARHLTTLMCAKHRSKVLDEIRKDLKQGRPCRLVSTSLIEAGVDVDFPLVLRAETGLDSIAQAAGRCNREGKQPVAESEVLVFTPANEDWKAPPELKQFAEVAATLFRKRGEAGDLLSPDAIHAYFEELYFRKGQAALDSGYLLKQLQSCQLDSLPMETLATEFRMIETVLMPVIIPYDEEACKVLNKMRFSDKIGESARKLQPYLVQVSRAAFKSLHNLSVIQTIAPEKWGEQFVVLTDMQYYDSHTGLYWDEEPESWVW